LEILAVFRLDFGKVALIWSKMHLQQDSLPFLPLSIAFYDIPAQAWVEIKILRQFLAQKVTYDLRLFDF